MIGALLGDFFAHYADLGKREELERVCAGEEIPDFPEYVIPSYIRMSAAVMHTMQIYKEGKITKEQIPAEVAGSTLLWFGYAEVPAELDGTDEEEDLDKEKLTSKPLMSALIVSGIGWLFDTLDDVLEMTQYAVAGISGDQRECTSTAQAVTGAIFWMRESMEKEKILENCQKILDMVVENRTPEGEEAFRVIRNILDIYREEDSWEAIVKRAYVEEGRKGACLAGALADADYDESLGLIAEARLHLGPESLEMLDYLESFRHLYFGDNHLGDAICDLLLSPFLKEESQEEVSEEVREIIFRKLCASCSVYYPSIMNPSFTMDHLLYPKEGEDEFAEVDRKYFDENDLAMHLALVGTEETPAAAVFIQRPTKKEVPLEDIVLLKYPLRDGIQMLLDDIGLENLVINPGQFTYLITKDDAKSYLKYTTRILELEQYELIWKHYMADKMEKKGIDL